MKSTRRWAASSCRDVRTRISLSNDFASMERASSRARSSARPYRLIVPISIKVEALVSNAGPEMKDREANGLSGGISGARLAHPLGGIDAVGDRHPSVPRLLGAGEC